MADQTTDQPLTLSQALAEPTVHVRRGWITSLGLASLGMWMASLHPAAGAPARPSSRTSPRSTRSSPSRSCPRLGAIASGLATPLAGALSDRTTRQYPLGRMRGRRHRWTLSMALLAALSLVSWPGSTRCSAWPLLWVLFSAFQNGEYASLSAAIPDHVPVRQRATVAGWVGMPQALGLVVGTVAGRRRVHHG